MPDSAASDPARDRTNALLVVCVLAVASVVIALIGATPARVSSSELLGDPRTPGEAAFIASHRGGGAAAPENTIPAIEAALAAGFDYVEVDVALTADRVPVLMHDATVDRTTNGHGALAALTYDAVRSLDAGSWFSPEFAGTPVPSLTEFLDVLAGSAHRAIVELKGEWDEEAVAAALAEVAARELDDRIVLSSFDARTLAMAESESETIARMLILKHVPTDVLAAVEEAGVLGIVVDRKALLARPALVDDLHAVDVRVVVYTLNKDSQWDAVTALGVDGIVTDDPGTLSTWQKAMADGR